MELDYDELVLLDAAKLAEGGIKTAYDSLLPRLRQHIATPLTVKESANVGYTVIAGGTEYVVYTPGMDEENAWGRATVILFDLVNRQLVGSAYRLYAINGGNDLGGMFLTTREAEEARRALPEPKDWPYIPIESPPWYGQFH